MNTVEHTEKPRLTPVQKLGELIADKAQRWMPSPFVFTIILTYVAAGAAWLSEGSNVTDITSSWYEGFWSLLEFAMQMVLILVTATVVAYHPWVKRLILKLVQLPKSGPQAAMVVATFAIVTSWFSWGLGLIFGAILAREMGKRTEEVGMAAHYPLVAVAGYLGLGLTWGWGMSSSPGLLQATDGNVLMELGFVDRVIPSTEWVFHPYPLLLTVLALIYVCMCLYLLSPPKESCRSISQYVGQMDDSESDAASTEVLTPADKIDNSKILGGAIALTGVVVFANAFVTQGLGALDLNVLNFGFLMIGFLLYTSPTNYQKEFYKAVTGAAGIVMLYPFYAGIIGMMTGTGLVDTISSSLLAVATPDTFPVIAWITAGVLNVFVPSGGGEWAIVGGPMLLAGAELGIPPGQTIAAYAAGDAHTNLLNPFWAIPLLAITGLRARDLFGYAITLMVLLTPFLATALYFLPY